MRCKLYGVPHSASDAPLPKAVAAVPLLRRVSLKRFRSFPAASVELDNPTFLVGQNGAGKSNFADVFAFLAEAMTAPLPVVFDRRRGIAAVGYRDTIRRAFNLGLRVELENVNPVVSQAMYAFELGPAGSHGFEVVREQCVVELTDGSQNWFDRVRDRFRSSADSLKPVLDAGALALPLIAGDKRFYRVLRFLTKMQTYRIEPAVLRETHDPSGGTRLRPDGSNTANVLRDIERESPGEWQKIRALLQSIAPGTVDVRPKMQGDRLSLEFTQKAKNSREVKFPAFGMSDGTLRALGLVAAVFQPSTPSVLAIEDPEATMHPGALGTILDLLRHAARFMQVVVTTHSPDVLDARWIEDRHLRMVGWEDGVSHLAPVAEASRAALRERLMDAGELLRSNALAGAGPSALEPHQIRLFEESLT